MSTSTRASRVRLFAAWLFRSPRRLAVVAGCVFVVPVLAVFALSSFTPAHPSGAAQEGARKTCATTVAGFASEFFDTARPGWVERVTPWVEKGKRQQVTTIDPALVPTGQVRIVELTDDTASCDAVVQVTTGTGPAWVDVVAQRGIGAAPDWFVVEWSPHESR